MGKGSFSSLVAYSINNPFFVVDETPCICFGIVDETSQFAALVASTIDLLCIIFYL